MTLPSDLLDTLTSLDAALDESDDLAKKLHHLVSSLLDSVPTLIALSVTVTIDGYPLTMDATPDADLGEAQASISILLPDNGYGAATSRLVAHATDPAAFADLRRDAIHALGVHPEHITSADDRTDSSGLTVSEISTINHAIGILIDQGHTPESARGELHRRAMASGHELPAHARRVIGDVGRSDDTPDS